MEESMFYILMAIFLLLPILTTNSIINRIFFLKPMDIKYNIKTGDLKQLKNFYFLDIIPIVLSFIYFLILYIANKLFFGILILIYLVISVIYYYKIKRNDIIDYIKSYDYDLFDWNKVAKLDIDEETKKECFFIHNIDYDKYKT